jgi:hypothetical protein
LKRLANSSIGKEGEELEFFYTKRNINSCNYFGKLIGHPSTLWNHIFNIRS